MLAIGSSVAELQQIFVLLDTVAYEVPSITKAVDLCFKIFQVFNMEYQSECKFPWLFLQRGLYGMQTQYDKVTPRLCEILAILQ